jgi:hypothetical protein
MTPKQTEKLRTETSKFGMDFEPEFFSREEDVKHIIRWAKKEKVERKIVRQKLEEKGCHSIEHLQEMNRINLDWI